MSLLDPAGPRGTPLRVPWRGCALHRIHLPRSSQTHKHHVFPKYLQLRKWGEVRDRRTVDVCPTGHNDVHAALDAIFDGKVAPKGVGQREWEMATEAERLFNEGA